MVHLGGSIDMILQRAHDTAGDGAISPHNNIGRKKRLKKAGSRNNTNSKGLFIQNVTATAAWRRCSK